MNIKSIFLFFLGIVFMIPVVGQTDLELVDFRKTYETSNPVSKDSTFTFDQKLNIHQAFLDSAIKNQNQLNQLLGNLYIFMDYTLEDDFAEATPYLLEAEKIALESENKGWQGWVAYRAGILYIRIRQEEKAIETYKSAVELCGEAGDSLCLGESLEQLSAMEALEGKYKLSEEYFNQALPLLEKYGKEINIATAMSNYGNLQVMNGQMKKGIPYLERAMKMHQKNNRLRNEGKALNNLASAHRRLGEYDQSIEFLNKAIELNKEHQFFQNLIKNYMGMFFSYEGKNDYKKANEFLIKRYILKDSLIGIETQLKVEELDKKYETARIKSDLQKKEIDLITTQRRLERVGWLLFLLLSIATFGIWRWKVRSKINDQKIEESKENLKRMTRLLFEKNSVIKNLEEEKRALGASNEGNSESIGISENIYDQRILTKTDWLNFKTLFEKSYPNYLVKLRTRHPEISESEERLFLFVKLKLNRNEMAVILGISEDSVKKTRNRLRKRLELEKEASLESYIQNF